MLRVIRHRLASQDLDEIIAHFIDVASEETAFRVASAIIETCKTLSTLGERGSPRVGLFPELRLIMAKRPAHQYKIFYRVMPDAIEIVRIVHGARNEAEVFDA